MSEASLRRFAPLLAEAGWPRPVGTAPNCVRPSFARQRMYMWGDVAAACLAAGLPIPD